MILVSVRQKDAADLLLVLFEVGDVRDDQVNAQHIFVRECDAAVHDDDVVAVLDHGHVLADLVQTAERGDADLASRPCAALAAAAALRRRRLHGLCGDGGCDRSGRCGCRRGLRLLRPSCVVPLCGLLFRRGGILRMLRGGVLIVFCHKFSFVSVLQTNTPRKKTCAGAKIKSVGNAVGQTKSKSIRRSKNRSGRVYVGLERTAERTGGHFTHIKTVQQLQKYYTPSAAGMQEGLRKRKRDKAPLCKGSWRGTRLRGCFVLLQSFLLCNNPSGGYAATSLCTREAKIDCARCGGRQLPHNGVYTAPAIS